MKKSQQLVNMRPETMGVQNDRIPTLAPVPTRPPDPKAAFLPPQSGEKIPLNKEPKGKPPEDVVYARARQTAILQSRQARETRGLLRGAPRDIDMGGFVPPLSPFL